MLECPIPSDPAMLGEIIDAVRSLAPQPEGFGARPQQFRPHWTPAW